MKNSEYYMLTELITKEPPERKLHELYQVENWFRKKSKVLRSLTQEILLDIIQYCEFVTKQQDEVIIYQGERGHTFYIILRGSVSVLHKEALEDVDLGDEGQQREADRTTLGTTIVSLGEGAAFGEIALINPDCIRTASVVADERTDLVVIRRDLYNRSLSKVIAKEYKERTDFIDSQPLFDDWPKKLKKHLAACLKKETLTFDSPIFKQGSKVDNLYFIVSGEVKLIVDPEAHFTQYDKFLKKCAETMTDLNLNEEIGSERAYFPLKYLPQIMKYSRVTKAMQLQRSEDEGSIAMPYRGWSPSVVRRMNHDIVTKRINLSMCYLGEKQCVGDLELLLELDTYYATAVCNRETVLMTLGASHFDRLFRKRLPRTSKEMARQLRQQLTRRSQNAKIADCVPILRAFVNKLAVVSGEVTRPVKAATDDDDVITSSKSVDGSLVRSQTWAESKAGGIRQTGDKTLKKNVSFGRSKTVVLT